MSRTVPGFQQAEINMAAKLPTMQRTAPLQQRIIHPQMSVVLRLRNPGLEKQAVTWPTDLLFKTRELA